MAPAAKAKVGAQLFHTSHLTSLLQHEINCNATLIFPIQGLLGAYWEYECFIKSCQLNLIYCDLTHFITEACWPHSNRLKAQIASRCAEGCSGYQSSLSTFLYFTYTFFYGAHFLF